MINFCSCHECVHYSSSLEGDLQYFKCKKKHFDFIYDGKQISGEGYEKWLSMFIYMRYSTIPCKGKDSARAKNQANYLPYEKQIQEELSFLSQRLPGDDCEIIDATPERDPDACQEEIY